MSTRTEPHALEGGSPKSGSALVEVVAPGCAFCAALKPRVAAAAEAYEAAVPLVVVDLGTDPVAADRLGVRSVPTLIGYRDGFEVFRHTGSRTAGEVEVLFETLATEATSRRRIGSTDAILRFAAGAVLTLAAAVVGPAWPLAGLGITLMSYGVVTWVRAGR